MSEPQAKPMPVFDSINVLGLLNTSIARRGGGSTTYVSYIRQQLAGAPSEVLDLLVEAHKCFYITPTLTLSSKPEAMDARITVERKYTPFHGDRKPLCLIGCVLVDAGVPLTAFDGQMNDSMTVCNAASAGNLLDRLATKGVIACDSIAREVLATAQSAQDNKKTWGKAFDEAVQTHTRMLNEAHGVPHANQPF